MVSCELCGKPALTYRVPAAELQAVCAPCVRTHRLEHLMDAHVERERRAAQERAAHARGLVTAQHVLASLTQKGRVRRCLDGIWEGRCGRCDKPLVLAPTQPRAFAVTHKHMRDWHGGWRRRTGGSDD